MSDPNGPKEPRIPALPLLAAAVILCLAPFAGKAFHIDDPLFVWEARQIREHPGDFYGFAVNRYDTEMPVHEITQNPPLTAYYLALASLLLGWSETALHLAFLLPALAAVAGTFLLARRFSSLPGLAALAALLTPVFLVSATTVMCDVMMLAFFVWAVLSWIHGLERGGAPLLAAAALLIAAAALVKYFALSLIPLLFVYSLFRKRSPGAWALYFLIPLAVMAGYELLTHRLYGHGLLSGAAAYSSAARRSSGTGLVPAGITGLAFTGGCLAPVLFFAPFLWSRRVLFLFALAAAAALAVLPRLGGGSWSFLAKGEKVDWATAVQFSLFLAAGAMILALAVVDLARSKSPASLLLFLWTGGTFFFAAFLNWTMNGRSVLPLVPAAAILAARRIEARRGGAGGASPPHPSRALLPLLPALLPAAALSLAAALADYSLANTGREAALRIGKSYAALPGTLWFQGHWGFQYYMEKEGGKAIDVKRSRLRQGDAVVVPSNKAGLYKVDMRGVFLDETFTLKTFPWLTTMNAAAKAGFYSARCGPLPYAFGPSPPEEYRVYLTRGARRRRPPRGPPLTPRRAPSGR